MEGISAVTIFLPAQVERNVFLERIRLMPFNIFRIKGLVRFTDSEESFFFQYVSGRSEVTGHSMNETAPFIVLIGRDADKPEVMDYFRF